MSADGNLTVNSGSDLYSHRCHIGFEDTARGVVTVDGAGSTWTNHNYLQIGTYGSGMLNITDGGAVMIDRTTYVGHAANPNGTVNFSNGTLTTESLFASARQLTGTGTINTRGLVSDIDLLFDSPTSVRQTLTFNSQPDQNIAVNLDMSDPSNVGSLGAGWMGNGSLSILDGITVNSTGGCIGECFSSTGAVTVDGPGSTWTNSQSLSVAHYGSGTLNISDGGAVRSSRGYVGSGSTSTGGVTVDGTGSTWANHGTLYVGRYGSGNLSITGGAAVSSGSVYVGRSAGSMGVVSVEDPGSTCINGSILSVGHQGSGTLSIGGGGAVSSALAIIGYYSNSGNVVSVDGAGSMWVNDDYLYVGYEGSGTLNISGGGAVSSTAGYIGYSSRSASVVTVDGTGSTWTNSGGVSVGGYGSGALIISGGSAVSNTIGYVGYGWHSTGMVMVEGTGSTWTNSEDLWVGYGGRGTLGISARGSVAAASVTIYNSESLLAIDVGNGSTLTIDNGTGEIDNDGTVRIIAGAGPEAGAGYAPIVAGTWTGSGRYQAIGGTWDGMDHLFHVSGVEECPAEVEVVIDLAERQRVMIDDGGTGWSVGASFLAMPTSTSLGFEAVPIGGEILDGLEELLHPAASVLSGWEFLAAGGYASGDPAYLSFEVGPGYSRKDLLVWHRDGGDWGEYAAMDLTYDGQYASFTVTDLSGYAVTTVPEPATLTLLLVGLGSMVVLADKRHRTRRSGIR